jgi:acyl CoA:acetate/3-ketoacid CoA transferase alpha subunit
MRVLDGREMLFETPLKAKVSYLKAAKGDKYGNLRYHATGMNFNPPMAFAGETVVAEVDELVDFLDPDDVHTVGVLVDYIVRRGR